MANNRILITKVRYKNHNRYLIFVKPLQIFENYMQADAKWKKTVKLFPKIHHTAGKYISLHHFLYIILNSDSIIQFHDHGSSVIPDTLIDLSLNSKRVSAIHKNINKIYPSSFEPLYLSAVFWLIQ